MKPLRRKPRRVSPSQIDRAHTMRLALEELRRNPDVLLYRAASGEQRIALLDHRRVGAKRVLVVVR